MNEKSELLFGNCGSGYKISVKELLEKLPKDAKIVYIDPEVEYHSLFAPDNQSTHSITRLLIERGK